jgi:alcohol dehydrogenase class IV
MMRCDDRPSPINTECLSMRHFSFHMPVRAVFGAGRLAELPGLVPARLQRILVVTDPGLTRHGAALSALGATLAGRTWDVFDEVEENPTFVSADKGAARARAFGAQAVIGLGGGSPLDAAKGVALLGTNDGTLGEYLRGKRQERDALPIIALPTTSGTGSEVTPYAVFTDTDAGTKGALSHPSLFPFVSIIDPVLTYSMPEALVVATGLDALTHAVEAFLSTDGFAVNDRIALEAVETVLAHLPAARRKDPSAMDAMAYASMLGGMAITHASTILPHIMGYPLTVFHRIPHGLANAVLLPEFLRYLAIHSSVPDKVAHLTGMMAPHGGLTAFIEDLGVSCRLRSYGMTQDDIARFVPRVIVKGDIKITPAPITEAVIAALYAASL